MRKLTQILILFVCVMGIGFFSHAEAEQGHTVEKTKDTDHQLISDVKYQDEFNEYIYRHLGKDKTDVIVSRFHITGNKPVPEGNVSFRLFQKSKGRLDGYVRLAVIVSVNGFAENEVMLYGKVDVFGNVICLSRYLKRGEIVNKDDLYSDRRNITRLSSDVLTDSDEAIGLVVKRNLKADTVLKEWMLEKAPVLDKGDVVTILAVLGDIKISVPGRILQKGYPGELIKVQNTMSNKEIYARVINNSTVSVDF